jgi:hypothetical protein
MKKKIIQEEIFYKHLDGDQATVRLSDFEVDMLPTDIIHIERDEGYYSDNNSWDPCTRLSVLREREETDEEYEKRKVKEIEFKKELKDRRYESYLKLKKEFENGEI